MRLLSLVVALAFVATTEAGVRPRPAPSEHHDSPLLAVLEGRDPRHPRHVPRGEALAVYRRYVVFDLEGNRIGDLARYPRPRTPIPAFRVVAQDRSPRGILRYDHRRPGQGFVLQNTNMNAIGRWFPLRVTFREYELRDREGNALGALVARGGTRLWELRGGDEALELLERFGWPVDTAALLRRQRFRDLTSGLDD